MYKRIHIKSVVSDVYENLAEQVKRFNRSQLISYSLFLRIKVSVYLIVMSDCIIKLF